MGFGPALMGGEGLAKPIDPAGGRGARAGLGGCQTSSHGGVLSPRSKPSRIERKADLGHPLLNPIIITSYYNEPSDSDDS